MSEKIKHTKTLTKEEQRQLFGWGDDIFGGVEQNLSWRPMELRFILEIDGKAVSHVGLIKDEILVGNKAILIAGVGDIVTIPAMQGKGVARKLMNYAHHFMLNEWQVDFGVLFCFERLVPYYKSLGWEEASNSVSVMQPSGMTRFPNRMMVFPVTRKTWPSGTIRLNCLPW